MAGCTSQMRRVSNGGTDDRPVIERPDGTWRAIQKGVPVQPSVVSLRGLYERFPWSHHDIPFITAYTLSLPVASTH